jgi:peptidoglycan/xylan/chitin deacetylase (PgdA/CDA1 family)
LSSRANGVPVLMYHSISDSVEHTHPYYQTVTTPAAFAKQMQFLHRNGYRTVNLSDVARGVGINAGADNKLVAITFDDGYRDFYRNAFPIMSEYGFRGTMYLPTAYIGDTTREFKGHACLTWSEVRELHRSGVEFGSHTVNHPQLASLETDAVRYEVDSSKATIESRLGHAVRSFAYPYAFPETRHRFVTRLRELLEEAGYDNGVSTMIGTADRTSERLFMKRLPVNSADDSALFRAKLEGSYDWLHAFQYASKLVSTSIRRTPRVA